MANIMGVSNRPDAQQSGRKRAHEDEDGEDGEDGSAKIVSPIVKERAERKNQRKYPKLDQQECFLMAVGLIHVNNVWWVILIAPPSLSNKLMVFLFL